MIDRTPPAVPTGLTAQLMTNDKAVSNVIYLTWTEGTEQDLGGYTLYRSTEENGTYTQVYSGTKKLSYTDRSALISGQTYYYKLTCRDTTGNESAACAPVPVMFEQKPDETAPRVISVSSTVGYTTSSGTVVISDTTKILAKVYDNQAVKTLYFRYQTSTDAWSEWAGVEIGNAEWVGALPLSVADISGDQLLMELYCEDTSGNISKTVSYSFDIDRQPPTAPLVSVSPAPMAITVHWSSDQDYYSCGFRLYRSNSSTGIYTCIARFANSNKTEYTYTDNDVSVDEGYSYYVEAIDQCGNASSSTKSEDTQPLNQDIEKPIPRVNARGTGRVGIEMSFSAANSYDNVGIVSYAWDFGDGGTSNLVEPVHAYQESGEYTASLTVSDAAGNQASVQFPIKIKEEEQSATLTVTVRDENGTPIPDAGVYFNFETDAQEVSYTNSSGVAPIIAESGSYVVAAYKVGYLPAKTSVSLVNGVESSVALTLVKGDVVTGDLTVTRMTLDEIEAAGIDTASPANQQVFQNEIRLQYGTEVVWFEYITNNNGLLQKPTPVTITDSYGTKRWLCPIIDIDYENDVTQTPGGTWVEHRAKIFPVFDFPFEATWMKDFFDVHLYVFNEADETFVLDNCEVQLNVPEGLTLMQSAKGSNPAKVDLGSIRGQSSKKLDWIIRGDVAGEYTLSADFSGTLYGFNEQIEAHFETEEPFRVRNGDNLHLDVLTESSIQAYQNGELRIGLRNEDPEPYYRPNITLEHAKLVRKFKTSGGVETESGLETLNPGEELWFYYEIERDAWEILFQLAGNEFNLVSQIFEKLGTTNIQVHYGTFDGGGNEPDASIKIEPVDLRIGIGESQKITVTTTPANAQYTLVSSDESVVSITGNTVTGRDVGKAEIVASLADDPNVRAVCSVAVMEETEASKPGLYVGIVLDGQKVNSGLINGKVTPVTDYSTYPLFALYVDDKKEHHEINPSDCQWSGAGVGINMYTPNAPNAFIDPSVGLFHTKAVQSDTVSFSATYTTQDGKELKSEPCKLKIQKLKLGSDEAVLQYAAMSKIVYTDFVSTGKIEEMITAGTLKDSHNAKDADKFIGTSTNTGATWSTFYSATISDWELCHFRKLGGLHGDGFYGALFKSPSGGYVLAFRGTDGGKDVSNDIALGLGNSASQLEHACEYYDSLLSYGYSHITLTGHSLGGGMANYVSVLRGVPAVTFNAPSTMVSAVISNTRGFAQNFRGLNDNLRTDYVNFSDWVGNTGVGDNKSSTLTSNVTFGNGCKGGLIDRTKFVHDQSPNNGRGTGLIGSLAPHHFFNQMLEYNKIDATIAIRTQGETYPTTESFLLRLRDYALGSTKGETLIYDPTRGAFSVGGAGGSGAYVFGGDGNDTLKSRYFAASILSDVLHLTTPNGGYYDVLCGGRGDDIYTGNWLYNAHYLFSRGDGHDTIHDYGGSDYIYIYGYDEGTLKLAKGYNEETKMATLEIQEKEGSNPGKCIITADLFGTGSYTVVNGDTNGVIGTVSRSSPNARIHVAACPVDMIIYDTSGSPVCTLKDGVEMEQLQLNGYFSVVEQDGEYIKAAMLFEEGYTVKLIGVGEGSMEYSCAILDGTGMKARSVENVTVQPGAVYTAIGLADSNVALSGDLDGDNVEEKTVLFEEPQYITLNPQQATLFYGATISLDASVVPSGAPSAIQWTTSNSEVAVVD